MLGLIFAFLYGFIRVLFLAVVFSFAVLLAGEWTVTTFDLGNTGKNIVGHVAGILWSIALIFAPMVSAAYAVEDEWELQVACRENAEGE